MKLTKIMLAVVLSVTVATAAQGQNFFHRIDVGMSNIYGFALSNLATAGLNYAAKDMLFDNYYNYTLTDITAPGTEVDTKNYSPVGLTARDAFNDVTGGLRLGYSSFNPGTFNWCVYASGHYRLSQFKTALSGMDEWSAHKVHRVQVGGGLQLALGKITTKSRVVFDVGLRYNIPISYRGAFGDKAGDVLQGGLTSHYAIRINGFDNVQGLGVWAEVPHYNMLKSGGAYLPAGSKMKMFSFGLVYTITPWRVKEAYD